MSLKHKLDLCVKCCKKCLFSSQIYEIGDDYSGCTSEVHVEIVSVNSSENFQEHQVKNIELSVPEKDDIWI